MSHSHAKPITSLSVTLLAQQAFHDVMQQQLPNCGEPGTFCIGDSDDVGFQAEQIASQFQALLLQSLGLDGGPGALPSLAPMHWHQ